MRPLQNSLYKKMKSIRLALFLLLGVMATGCTLYPAILYLKDGTELKGHGNTYGDHSVRFKTKGSKMQTYPLEELKKVVLYEGDEKNTYVAIKIKGKRQYYHGKMHYYHTVRQVIEGPVSLYEYRILGGEPPGSFGPVGVGPGGMMVGGGTSTVTKYLVKRKNEPEATLLSPNNIFSKSFKNAAIDYFQDCPSLVEKIRNRTFKKKNVEALVKYYNYNCQ